MYNFKEIVDNLKESISNYNDKNDSVLYSDIRYMSIDEHMHKVAKYGAEKCMEIKFTDDMSDSSHPLVRVDEDIAKEIGIPSILIYNYKGYEEFGFIESNYMFMVNNDIKSLMIDLYDCENSSYGKIYSLILQELANFVRDGNEYLKSNNK